MKHAELAVELGIPRENISVAEIGNVIEFTSHGAKFANNVIAGRVFIDGLGIGDIRNSVMKIRPRGTLWLFRFFKKFKPCERILHKVFSFISLAIR